MLIEGIDERNQLVQNEIMGFKERCLKSINDAAIVNQSHSHDQSSGRPHSGMAGSGRDRYPKSPSQLVDS